MKVISALVMLHKAGVTHGDFADRNLVITKKGAPCLIDFGHAQPDHKCGLKMAIEFHTPRPRKQDFGCDELYEACRALVVWTPRAYYISKLLLLKCSFYSPVCSLLLSEHQVFVSVLPT